MKTYLLIFLLTCSSTFAQKNLSISGKITEKKTGDPLPFATIGIKGSPHGTISNLDGEFNFFLPDRYLNDTLFISYVGFESFSIIVRDVIEQERLDVALKERIIVLEEVEVNSEQLTGSDIVARALEKLEENYSSDPFVLKGFFRDVRDQNDQTVYLVEAAVDIQDQGFSLKSHRPKKFYLKGVRASDTRINPLLSGSLLNSGNSLTVNLEHDYWLNRLNWMNRLKGISKNELVIEEVRSKNDRLYYVISTEQLEQKSGLDDKYKDMQYKLVHRYHIDTETFAIHKVEHLEYPLEGNYVGIEFPYPGDSLYYSKKGWNQVIEFEPYQGKMYMKYHDVSYSFDIVDEKNDRIYLDMAYQFTFITTEIATKSQKPEGEKMNRNKPLLLQANSYDDDFWKDPNNAKLTPLTQKQIKGLESEKPLNEQFRSKKIRQKRNSK